MSTSPAGRGGIVPLAWLTARAAALGLTLTAAGCASDGTHRRYAYAYPGTAYDAPPVQRPPVPRAEIEDDGLPAQTPPMRRRVSEPDDPTEPFSPNYGTVPPRSQARSLVDDADSGAGNGAGRRNSQDTGARPDTGPFVRPVTQSEPRRVLHNRMSTSALARTP